MGFLANERRNTKSATGQVAVRVKRNGLRIKARIKLFDRPQYSDFVPLHTGISTPVDFGAEDENGKMYNDTRIDLIDRELLLAGEECEAVLSPLFPELVERFVHAGDPLELWVGIQIGEGVISQVYEA